MRTFSLTTLAFIGSTLASVATAATPQQTAAFAACERDYRNEQMRKKVEANFAPIRSAPGERAAFIIDCLARSVTTAAPAPTTTR